MINDKRQIMNRKTLTKFPARAARTFDKVCTIRFISNNIDGLYRNPKRTIYEN